MDRFLELLKSQVKNKHKGVNTDGKVGGYLSSMTTNVKVGGWGFVLVPYV